jgi:hypothetical protein
VKTTRSRLLLGLCAAAAVWAAGCKAPPKPMKFNKLLVESNTKLAEAGKAFRKTVEPLSEGKPVKAGDVESSYRSMESALASVKSEWEDMKAPMNSSAGPTVLEKYQAFLDAEEKVLQRYQGIVNIVKDGQLAPAAKWSRINGVFQAIADEEGKALRPVREAQTAYAKEHNLQLDQMFFGGGGPMGGGSGGPGMSEPPGAAPPGMGGRGGSGSGRGGPPMMPRGGPPR